MRIESAAFDDLQAILVLQYLAYQSEAQLLNDNAIQPLRQTLSEVMEEFTNGIVLKAVDDHGAIIGSIRCRSDGETCYVAKLFVHPSFQKQGIGTGLLLAIEKACPRPRYELFTSNKSNDNIRLYERAGYIKFTESDAPGDYSFIFMEKRAPANS